MLFDSFDSVIFRSRDTNQELGKIAKIYRALVSGVIDDDTVIVYLHFFLVLLVLCTNNF